MTDDPKREFVETLVAGYFLPETKIAFDRINYRHDGEEVPMPESFETFDDILNGLRALTAPGTGFIRHVDSSGANVLFLRVRDYEGSDRFLTLIFNRWHDNVNSLFREGSRLDPTKDTIDFHSGSIGSYPNYFLDVAAEDIPEFFDVLENFDGSDAYLEKFQKYGVNRGEDHFWQIYDWFQHQLDEADPLTAGLYDLNRYRSDAISETTATP
jgi:hypothetical protein